MRLIKASFLLLILLPYVNSQNCYAETSSICKSYSCYTQLAQSGQDENSFIKKNQEAVNSSTNRALFTVYRIKCLNTSGINGLNACNKALSIDPNITALRKRKATLSAQLYPKRRPAIVQKRPLSTPKRHTPQKTQTKPLAPQKVKIIKAVKKPNKISIEKTIARKRAKELITEIQQLLIKLGFNVSSADGIAGKNTKKAIDNFLKISDSNLTSKTNKALLSELNNAYGLHKHSDIQYKTAVILKEQGKLQEALKNIKGNLKTTPWHQQLIALRNEVNESIISLRNKELEEVARQTSFKKAQKEAQLVQQQINRKNDKKNKLIENLLITARLKLSDGNFKDSLKTITEGLELSPQNPQFLRLQDEVIFAQKKYVLNQHIQETIQLARSTLKNKEYRKTSILISKGLNMDPSSQALLKLRSTLNKVEEQADKLSEIVLLSRELLTKQAFEKTISLTNKGLLIEPNNPILLDINHKASIEKEKHAKNISLIKQRTSTYLALVARKKSQLLTIEEEVMLKNNFLYQEAQKTLTEHWIEISTTE